MPESIFKVDAESVLTHGLKMMTKACDALTEQNEILNEDIKKLKNKVANLQEKILLNSEEKE